jgi:hypothetical protein
LNTITVAPSCVKSRSSHSANASAVVAVEQQHLAFLPAAVLFEEASAEFHSLQPASAECEAAFAAVYLFVTGPQTAAQRPFLVAAVVELEQKLEAAAFPRPRARAKARAQLAAELRPWLLRQTPSLVEQQELKARPAEVEQAERDSGVPGFRVAG